MRLSERAMTIFNYLLFLVAYAEIPCIDCFERRLTPCYYDIFLQA